jgi:hypothetical protein
MYEQKERGIKRWQKDGGKRLGEGIKDGKKTRTKMCKR